MARDGNTEEWQLLEVRMFSRCIGDLLPERSPYSGMEMTRFHDGPDSFDLHFPMFNRVAHHPTWKAQLLSGRYRPAYGDLRAPTNFWYVNNVNASSFYQQTSEGSMPPGRYAWSDTCNDDVKMIWDQNRCKQRRMDKSKEKKWGCHSEGRVYISAAC